MSRGCIIQLLSARKDNIVFVARPPFNVILVVFVVLDCMFNIPLVRSAAERLSLRHKILLLVCRLWLLLLPRILRASPLIDDGWGAVAGHLGSPDAAAPTIQSCESRISNKSFKCSSRWNKKGNFIARRWRSSSRRRITRIIS